MSAIVVGSRVKNADTSKSGSSAIVDASKGTVQAITTQVTRRWPQPNGAPVSQSYDEAAVLFDGSLIPVVHVVVGLSQ